MTFTKHTVRAWLLLALMGCGSAEDDEGNLSLPSGIQGQGSDNQGPATGMQPADNGGSQQPESQDAGTEAPADAGSDSDIDVNDPPKPTEACGMDLDVKNGRVTPRFGTPAQGETFSGDPLADGPLKVVSTDQKLKNPDPKRNDYNVTAYGPSTDGTSIDAGPFPLVVVLPGFSGNHTGYGHFTNHFVSHGFAVLGITPANVAFTDAPNNPANVAEIQAAIKWALEESPLKGKLNEQQFAIAGHSQGGKLAYFTAVTDARFKIAIGWDPQNGGGAPCFIAGVAGQNCDMWPVAPVCDKDRKFEDAGMMANIRGESLVFAARDGNVTPDAHLWAENFYRGAPSPAHLGLFTKAGHGDWAAANAVTEASKRVQMALLLTRFKGVKGLEKYLPDGDYLKGVPDVEVHNK